MFLNWFSSSKIEKARRELKKINALKEEVSLLDFNGLKERSLRLQEKIQQGLSLDEALPEAFALSREMSKITLGQFPFDTQLLGGINLHYGSIVEMMTGEGKTLSCVAPVYLNALSRKGVHVITVNDYLTKRDVVWMGQVYHALGLKVACIVHSGAFMYDPQFKIREEEAVEVDKERDAVSTFKVEEQYLRPISRQEAYLADITYGTNHEFGFDYLRDNLASSTTLQVQRSHNFAVIDEVDSILIDEARTPLIISAPDQSSSIYYKTMTDAASILVPDVDYIVDEKNRNVQITESGIEKVEAKTGVADLFSPANLKLVHYLEECLKAKALFSLDKDYVIHDGNIVIVDQFTGRLMHGRRYSGGLHQAIEAKEGLTVQDESKTYAQITIQNYFRLYEKVSGMTGTAQTSAEEFHKVYNLEVVTIPTNKPIARKDLPDLIYGNEKSKFEAIAKSVKQMREEGRPVLIGTASIEKNEALSKYLTKLGIAHEALNAKNHEREGAIIAQAGRRGAVTLATNMAGRGVDIILGGSPYDKERAEEIKNLGGLHVIGTERHDARRIDNQLRGRAGRQGDPGSSQFYLSLDDDLMRIFGGDRLKNIMKSLKIPEDQPIESGIVTKALVEAQKKVEGINFDSRKHLLEYDDILNKQRTHIYNRRQQILSLTGDNLKNIIKEIVQNFDDNLASYGENLDEVKNQIFAKLEIIQPMEIVRPYILQAMDALWMNHLEDLESLSETVRIRAYAQHDPIVEYRRDSHSLYLQMISNFDRSVFEMFAKMQLVPSEEIKQEEVVLTENNETTFLSKEEMVGIERNDQCPCGSGKKYKKCHGR